MAGQRMALVVGASGGIGGALARALIAHGWRVRGLARDPGKAARGGVPGIEWVQGDAMIEADVVRAASGISLLFHGANPPGYRNWRGLAIPMLRSSIAAALASHARLLFPGTIYNYAPEAGPLLSEATPQQPRTRKGAVRLEMEAMLRGTPGLRTLIVRAGDFFGGPGGNNWFNAAMVKPGQALRAVIDPCTPGVGHAWAYLPDLAETMALLAEREADLPAFDSFHFAGHWTEPGREMAEAIRRAAGNPDLPIHRFPWPVIYLAAPFVTMMREMIEMRYLWRTPLRLDNRKLVALLGEEPHTPLDVAVRRSLAGLGCLPPAEPVAPALARGTATTGGAKM